jgi:hypothetical protein
LSPEYFSRISLWIPYSFTLCSFLEEVGRDIDDWLLEIPIPYEFESLASKNGDVYKVCALTIKDSNLICETGTNSPALRPEFKDLYIQEERPATSQAAKIPDGE